MSRRELPTRITIRHTIRELGSAVETDKKFCHLTTSPKT